MQSIQAAVAAFDALVDTDRRTVLRWIEHDPRLIRVTFENLVVAAQRITRRHFTEYGPDIRNKLLAVPGVKDATVNIDPAGFADVVVTGGDDQALFDALLASVPAGVGTRGDVVGSARDSQGTTHPMRFTRAKSRT
jgi:phosphoglycolate phosphatase-like HAD superfamily hydrolase